MFDVKSMDDELFTRIHEAEDIIPVLLVGNQCDTGPTALHQEFSKALHSSNLELPELVVLCFPADKSPWPIPITQIMYYFLPHNTVPVFYSRGLNVIQHLEQDVIRARKMMEGLSYEEASYSESECETIIAVEAEFKREEEEEEEYPPAHQMVLGLGRELWKTAKAAGKGLPVVATTKQKLDRFTICEACPHFNAESTRCTKCGCRMKNKVNWATAECPIGKW